MLRRTWGAPYVLGTLGGQTWVGGSLCLGLGTLSGHLADTWRTITSLLDLTPKKFF